MNIKEITKENGTTVYRASVYLGVDQLTGKKARTTVTASTKRAVKVKAREALNNFASNGYTVKKRIKATTYRELVALWWDGYKETLAPNSLQSIEGFIRNHLLPPFGDYKLDKLTRPVIQTQVNKWANKANKGEKGAFKDYKYLANINKMILQYAVTMDLLETNPARDIVVPRLKKQGKKEIKHYTNQQVKQFLDYLDSLDQSDYANLFDTVLYKLLLATGLRIGEALALEWSDIDLENATVSVSKTVNRLGGVNPPKSKASNRLIDIDHKTVLMLKQYKNRQQVQSWQLKRTEKVVFSVFTDKYAKANTLKKRLEKHFQNVGTPDIGFHGFRHTHASIMMNAGIGYKELQHRLGHSNLSMTMDTYSHLSKEKAKKAVSFYETAISNL